jgi:hypothetical protein
MNWFQQNRWLGTFLIVFGICTLLALFFLFSGKSGFEEANVRFNDAAVERGRLERVDPFPTDDNYREMKVHLENYGTALDKFKEELKTHVFPIAPLAPNEFQSRLRQAMLAVSDKAHANKVKLPDNFHLGFDEFTTALPDTAAAPLLGQQLAQAELLMNILIDARVDSVTAFQRKPLTEQHGAAAAAIPAPALGRKPAAAAATGPKLVERGIVDLAFMSSPSVARKVLNQIAGSNQQLYVIRTLHVRNEQEKGPRRESTEAGASTAAPKPTPSGSIKFIVGDEHIEMSARIEMVRFTF